MEEYKKNRRFLKSSIWKEASHHISDQRKGLEEPAKEKPLVDTTEFIELTKPQYFKIGDKPLKDVIQNRKSHRNFSTTPLTIEELSYLLWATQGLRKERDTRFRTVPSAGARHPFETYLYIREVESLSEGFYRYLPLEHKLAFLFERTDAPLRLVDACFGQSFIGKAAVTFMWTVIPYRSEWRYHATSYKVIALDAGHLCQNLYLACDAIDAGTCAIAAYDQDKMDMLLDVDGDDEFVIYLAPVGKLPTT
jgi:SagB-type dehydrogenase family enzyme